ncbi:haloacid dehalogenase-like hydrolase domain-containing protein 3 [Solanum pennellii]|uniref:Haloacid dehalogenase-like hydrolase domain-containing protein 3 n=1 Tax=Solanum pennellii TaxID=28526 RepID=A0ABM1G3Q0_SOLPN|nr:haloacid dehalogenase-like hydrolase domain-containing protein 3 [Solanum pennellii]
MLYIVKRLRCITLDITGTLIAYKGDLGDSYCLAVQAVGRPCPSYKRVDEGFKVAYAELAKKHPCFGFADNIPNYVWWKICVRDSFVKAGYEYDDETFENIYSRIYATFGSAAPYRIFPDAIPFLRWLRKRDVTVGLVSNAEYRYRDIILPALGLNQGSEWDFGVFSGLEGVEKPDPRIFEIALKKAGNVAPEEALHIGDSLRKDYLAARGVGMHALLLDRFKTADAVNGRKSGAIVLPDLTATKDWLTSEKLVSCP